MLRRRAGFSLLELVCAVAVVAILAALVLPGFERQVLRARRADAQVAALRVQTAQERYRSHAPRYGSLGEIGIGTASEAGHYALDLPNWDADGFELLLVAMNHQARDQDCRYLSLQWRHMTPVLRSGPDMSFGNASDANLRCWGQA